jgi:hypothetical protein
MAVRSSFNRSKHFQVHTAGPVPRSPDRGGRAEALHRWLSVHTAHPAAPALRQAAAELAWLAGPPAASEATTLEPLLEGLLAALDQGGAALHSSCADVRSAVLSLLKARLNTACRQDCENHQPYSQAWVSACAELLLTAEGAVDPTLFPAIADMPTQGAAGWLPPDWPEEAALRLRQLMDPTLKLPQQINRLSCTQPLHPQVDGLRRLQFVGSDRPVRHQLATLVLMFHFTPPRQPQDMGVCWLVAPKALRHLNQPDELLQSCTLWFQQGLIECSDHSRQDQSLSPSLYPVHALQWASRPLGSEDPMHGPVGAKLLHALQCVQGGASQAQWSQLLRSVALQLRQDHRRPSILQLLRGVLMAQLNAAQGWALTESRLARAPERQSPVLRERAARLETQLQDCLGVIESQTLNLMTACWQLATARQVTQGKLEAAWAVLEPLLLEGLDRQSLPGDVPAYLAHLRALFLANADLRYERDAATGETGFRLHLKLPGVSGRGTPVGDASQLLEWIGYFSRELVKRFPQTDFAHLHAALLKRFARVNKQALAKALALGGAPLRHGDTPSGGIWFLEVGSRFEASVPALSMPSGVRSEDFVELYLCMASLRWDVVAAVDPWVAPRTSLNKLLSMLRSVQALAGPDLQFALKRMNGRVLMYLPQNAGGDGAHVMTLLARREPLQSIYKDAGSIDEAIESALVKPMRQALQQRLPVGEAAAWLKAVLQACVLKQDVELDAVVQQLLAQAMKRTPDGQEDCSLQALILALRMLQRSPADSPWLSPKPWRNGLSVAVLNELPFEVPVLIYGDPNWEGQRIVLYCQDPITRDIGHFSANECFTGSAGQRIRFVAPRPSYLF